MKKHVLLTGAGPRGFVGRNIAPALAEQYELFTPSSRELNLCEYDAVSRYLDEHQISMVVHSAAQNTIKTGPGNAMLHDLQMFYNLEKLSGKLDKMLFFGSGAAFDKRYPEDMIREEDLGRSIPVDYYGLNKYIMDRQARNSTNIYDLRLFGIFGKYEYWQLKFISNLCCKAMYDLPLSVRQNCMFDFMDVDDLAPIVLWFVEHTPKYHDYNICTGKPMDLVSIAHLVNKAAQKELPVVVAKEGWNLAYTADNKRLKEEMPDVKFRSMEESIEKLYTYYCEHRKEIPYEEVKATH